MLLALRKNGLKLRSGPGSERRWNAPRTGRMRDLRQSPAL